MQWQARPSTCAFVLLKTTKTLQLSRFKTEGKVQQYLWWSQHSGDLPTAGCQKHLLSPGVILPALPYVGLEGAELSVAQSDIVGWPFIQRWIRVRTLGQHCLWKRYAEYCWCLNVQTPFIRYVSVSLLDYRRWIIFFYNFIFCCSCCPAFWSKNL